MVTMEKMIGARKLLTYKRLDLMAKYTYVEHKLKGYSMDWAQELYLKHIEAFTDGLYQEPGTPEKNSRQIFLDTFDALIEDIGANGFDPTKGLIPLGADGVMYNGAHRTTVCAYFDMEVPYCTLDETCCYDYFFFKRMRLPEVYLDYMVTKYTELFPEKCYVICLWPRACAKKDLVAHTDALLGSHEKIGLVAAKTIPMNAAAVRNFSIHCYRHHDWVAGPRQHFEGVDSMALLRYDTCNKMRVYVVEAPDGGTIWEIKQQLRAMFDMEYYSVHSSDNPQETKMMMQMLFNANSLDMMNRGAVDYDVDLAEKITDFEKAVKDSGQPLEDFILDSSAVLGLYQLRKVNDLDYLALEDRRVSLEWADNHENYAHYYQDSVENLIRDPRKHLYILGVKCITLDVLSGFKEARGERKDKLDLALIRQKKRDAFTFKRFLELQWVNVLIGIRNLKALVRVFLEKNNIYFFTKVWHWLHGWGYQ